MTVRGMDISNHQSSMDVERVVRENDFGFVFILTNDGTFVNKYFHAQADAAERGGAIVRPYTYLRPNWAQTIDTHVSIVDGRYGDSIVDVEEGSGAWHETWSAHNRLWDRGQDTNLLYWPNFHWSEMGRPDLSPLATKVRGHWKSWYPDRNWDPFDVAWSKVPPYVWADTRGGIPVSIVQFTGTGRVSGYGAHVDLNYYSGTREELAALLGGDTVSMQDVFNAFSAMAKGETHESTQAAEDLRSVLVHYKFVKAPDTEVRVLNEETGETNESTPHDENRWQTANFDRLAELIKANAGGGVPVEGGEISDENAAKVARAVVAELKKEGN